VNLIKKIKGGEGRLKRTKILDFIKFAT
jgi:hypothetical protein